MSEDERAMDVGQEIANLLLILEPKMEPEDIVGALMHALERYSIELEGASESELSQCIHELRERLDNRLRSI